MPSNVRSRRGLSGSAVAVAAALLVTLPGTSSAASLEVSLAAHYNNLGTTTESRLPAFGDFDGGGYSWSAAALQAGNPAAGQGGIVPGKEVTAGGFTFTWPAPAAGRPDNVETAGQQVAVPALPGATAVGFLAAATRGNQSAVFTFGYEAAGGGVEDVETTVGFTDWTRGLTGDGALEHGNTVVLQTAARHSRPGTVVYGTRPNVFLVTVPLEPGRTLRRVTLPSNADVHLFAMALK